MVRYPSYHDVILLAIKMQSRPGINIRRVKNMAQPFSTEVLTENNATGTRKEREQARPVKRVLDRRSHEVVGWLYRWNTGHLAVMWKAEKCDEVVYE